MSTDRSLTDDGGTQPGTAVVLCSVLLRRVCR